MVAAIKSDLKWMILGANGQLGQALQLELGLNNLEFVAFNHGQLDITHENDMSSAFHQIQPDVVVNAAAWTNVDLAEQEESSAYLVNAVGPRIAAQKSSEIGAKFVHISTDYVFSGSHRGPWAENDAPCPVSAYGRTKAAGERLVANENPAQTYIVRTAWLYSEYKSNFVKTMLKLAEEEFKSVEVVNDQVGQPTLASDLAVRIHQMIDQRLSPGIYHGTNSGEVSWCDFAREIFFLKGADPTRIVPVDSQYYSRPAKRPSNSVLGHKNWLNEGVNPMRDWKEALKSAFPVILGQVELER